MDYDGIVNDFPQPFVDEATPYRRSNFHRKTREACRNGDAVNLSLKVAKSLVVGDLSVGKTSLVNRYCRNLFEKDYKPTIGVEYELKKYEIIGQEFHLQMWDTSGEERFKCITGAYYRGANVVMAVFDLSSIRSLTNSRSWMEDALEKVKSTTPELFLVGNKLDIVKGGEHESTRNMAIELASELNAEYWEVSAKTGKNVKELFTRAAALCFDQSVLRETENLQSDKKEIGGGGGLFPNKQQQQQPKMETIVLNDSKTIPDTYEDKRLNKCCK